MKMLRILFLNEPLPEEMTRAQVGALEGWISTVANLLLFVIKLGLGLWSTSVALLADAFHTLSDILSSVVVIVGFRIAGKPPDSRHPFGHGRAEAVASLTIALMIGFIGLEFFQSGLTRIFNPYLVKTNWGIITAIALTMVVKYWLTRISTRLGNIIDSDALRGDAVHHLSDFYSSLLVMIALIAAQFGVFWLDGLMALGVAGFMGFTALQLARNAFDDLLGKPMDARIVKRVEELAATIPGVVRVHDIIVHSYGQDQYITLHVEISETENSSRMHQIADNVEQLLGNKLDSRVLTHIDPVTVQNEGLDQIRKTIQNVLISFEGTLGVQELRVVGNSEVTSIIFEVPVNMEFDDFTLLQEKLNRALVQQYPRATIQFDFKPQITRRHQ